MNKLLTLALTVACMAILPPASSLAADEADAALESFFRHYLEEDFQQRPLSATLLGDHRFDDRLDDLSPTSRKKWVEHARRTLESLPRRVEYAKLSPAGKIDYEILEHDLTRTIWLAENTSPFEEDPRVYNAYVSDSVYLLLEQSTLPKEKNLANAIARMRQIPKVLAAARESLTAPTRAMTETAVRQNLGSIAFYEGEILNFVGESPQCEAVKEAAAAVVPHLKRHQDFLEKQLLPKAKDNWRLGKERFARKLDLELNAGLTADQVLADAEAEFARVENDMYVIARQLWGQYYPGKPIPPDDEAGRRATIAEVLRAVAQDHGEPEDLADDAKATVDRVRRFIRDRNILALPEPDRCRVIEMPEFQRGNSTAYLNSAPPLDAKAPSFYAVSPPPKGWDAARVKSLLEEYNSHMLQILTIHEAYPGHYVQLEYANRNPSLIRRVLGSGVMIEGWAVYTEQMMLDQGYGNGNLPLRLTQLKFYLRAVTNAILDHKMHCTEMTDDEAMDLLVRRAFQSEGEAWLKVIRAKQSSAQLSTYFVGRMAMYRLRRDIQRAMGDRFDLARYHEALLDQGSVPVKYLPKLVRASLAIEK